MALYAMVPVITELPKTNPPASFPGVTLAAIAGAILIGYSGPRWLAAEASSKINRGALETTIDATDGALKRMEGKAALKDMPSAAFISERLKMIKASPPIESYKQSLELRELIQSGAKAH